MNILKLKKISAKNFRNISASIIEFKNNLVCFYGDNAQGKTNLLEMIYFLFHQKSFKKKVDFPQLFAIDGDKPEITISAEYENIEKNYLSLKINSQNTECYLNNLKIKKDKTYQSIFVLVPADSYQFFHERSERISWLDREIFRIDKSHSKNILNYARALKQRNILLQLKKSDLIQIKTLTETMVKLGIKIQLRRKSYITEIGKVLNETFKTLFDVKDELNIEYQETLMSSYSEEIYLKKWLDQLPFEMSKKVTKFGPHLDDMVLSINGFPIMLHGSMGQQKIAYFSLFFASIKYLNGPNGLEYSPIVLLDDISSEIDSLRWKSLIKYLLDQHFQVFITTANKTFLDALNEQKIVDVFDVKNGVVSKMS
jgi:DNA replication and repair protein RecF